MVTAYTLTTAISTPIWGKFGDLYGRKRLFLASIVVFLVASALAGTAQSMGQLIGFRALQGVGAGGLGAGAFALIASLVPPRERGRYQGMTATLMAIGTVGGPLLGGVITGHLGWRWAFYVNIPLGLVALVWVQVMLHLPATRVRARIDWAGIALMTAAIGSLVLAATWAGATYAWGSWQVLSAFAVFLVTTTAFIAVQRRAPEPVLPPRVFTEQRNFPLAIGLLLVAGVVMFGCSCTCRCSSRPCRAPRPPTPVCLLPLMIPVALVATVAGKVMSATGRYKIFPLAGTACLTAGTALLATMDTSTPRALTSVYLVLVGIGLGFTLQMSTTIAQNSVEMRDMGAASAATNLARTLGGSLGVAVFGSLLTTATGHASTGEVGSTAIAYRHALATATSHIFLTMAVVCAVGFLIALAVKEVPLRGKSATVPAQGAAAAVAADK